MWEMQMIPIVTIAGLTVGFVTCVRALVRYIELRREGRSVIAPSDVHELQERLTRIESVVETTALEVERIAEANRFMSKLLAERSVPAMPQPRQPERVVTPH